VSLLDAYTPIPARTIPVVLLLDTSGSMRENDKIEVLNDSVTEMIEELTETDAGHGFITLSIITFGGERADLVEAHTPVEKVRFTSLRANGRTPLGAAFSLARVLIEDREALPSRAYRPTIALVSDGIPTDVGWEKELDELVASERGSKATRFALAIGVDADREMLGRFSGGQVHEAGEAAEIRRFLRYVTMTVTEVTATAYQPDSPAAQSDSPESIARLQGDDAF
jgi:uncharacterized protein YegL